MLLPHVLSVSEESVGDDGEITVHAGACRMAIAGRLMLGDMFAAATAGVKWGVSATRSHTPSLGVKST